MANGPKAGKKREPILRAAFNLLCQEGYNDITTTSIAQAAGIAIGTLYKYYSNKKELFLDMYEFFFFEIASPSLDMMQNLTMPFAVWEFFRNIVDATVQGHNNASKRCHDALMKLVYHDDDFREKDNRCKLMVVDGLIPVLNEHGFIVPYIREKLHFAISILEAYAHEAAYKETDGLEYGQIKETMVEIIGGIIFK